MDEVKKHIQQPPFDPSTALILHAHHDTDAQVMTDPPAPDSARDLAYRLTRHAIHAALLVIQLFSLPLKLFLRRLIPSLYRFCQRSYVVRNILNRWSMLHMRLLHLSLVTSTIAAWSQTITIPQRLDRITVLLEENIELMSMHRKDESKASTASVEVCRPDDESVVSPVTASAIYHAALANNRTLDNLLDTFDGGRACTALYISAEGREDTPIQEVTSAWVGKTSTPQSAS